MTRHFYIHGTAGTVVLLLLLAQLLTGCVSDEVTATADEPVAVSFDTYLMQSRQETRADGDTHPDGTAGILMTTEKLKELSFGVFASYTEDKDYYRPGNENAFGLNFMFNQKVTWNGTAWVYSPVKYWPNDNTPADDQDNDTGNTPATGSKAHSYLHFFAYAPFYDYKVHASDYSGTADHLVQQNDYGLTDMPSTESDFYLIYRSKLKPGQDVDVLWAKQDYMYKMKPSGEGYTTGRVPFVFQHALSRLNITVMGLFDHVDTSDRPWEGYSDDVDANTRIQIEEVELDRTCIPEHGRWYLDPKDPLNQDNGSYNRYATSAYWEAYTQGRIYETDGFNDNVKKIDLGVSDANAEVNVAKDAFDALAAKQTGVDKTERNLFQNDDEEPLYFMFPPNNHYADPSALKPLQVRVKYRVVTYDPKLTLNTPKYFSIVKNDITATFPSKITFEPNKEYRLRLLLGLTSVKFEVLDVTDWQVPIVLSAVVKDWTTETHEYDVEN